MISLSVTNYLKTKFGSNYRFYRLFFNLIAFITITPVILYSANLKGPVVFYWDGMLSILRYALMAMSILLFILGAFKYDLLQLMGIRQIISGNSFSALSETGNIDTSGILGLMRHPWYLALMILLWVTHKDVFISKFIENIILTVYILIGTVLEERKLIIEYGDIYRDYQRRVSMLFPFKWILAKLQKYIELKHDR
jgi:protein-S-isoprenylcysteine O-methyltransferase Ste14